MADVKELEKAVEILNRLGTLFIPDEYKGALKLGIEALEKQIPKPVIRKDWAISQCPCCHAKLGEWLEDGYHKDYEDMTVCSCGQKITWDEPESIE